MLSLLLLLPLLGVLLVIWSCLVVSAQGSREEEHAAIMHAKLRRGQTSDLPLP